VAAALTGHGGCNPPPRSHKRAGWMVMADMRQPLRFKLVVEDIDFVSFVTAEGTAKIVDGLVAFRGGEGRSDLGFRVFQRAEFGGLAVGDN